MNKRERTKRMREIARLSHQKSPRSKEFYKRMSKLGNDKRWGKTEEKEEENEE